MRPLCFCAREFCLFLVAEIRNDCYGIETARPNGNTRATYISTQSIIFCTPPRCARSVCVLCVICATFDDDSQMMLITSTHSMDSFHLINPFLTMSAPHIDTPTFECYIYTHINTQRKKRNKYILWVINFKSILTRYYDIRRSSYRSQGG